MYWRLPLWPSWVGSINIRKRKDYLKYKVSEASLTFFLSVCMGPILLTMKMHLNKLEAIYSSSHREKKIIDDSLKFEVFVTVSTIYCFCSGRRTTTSRLTNLQLEWAWTMRILKLLHTIDLTWDVNNKT